MSSIVVLDFNAVTTPTAGQEIRLTDVKGVFNELKLTFVALRNDVYESSISAGNGEETRQF